MGSGEAIHYVCAPAPVRSCQHAVEHHIRITPPLPLSPPTSPVTHTLPSAGEVMEAVVEMNQLEAKTKSLSVRA